MRIELTQAILMTRLKFSEKFNHPFSYVFIFGNMFHESQFHLIAGYKLEEFHLHQLDKDKLEQNLCIVSTIHFLLDNLVYE